MTVGHCHQTLSLNMSTVTSGFFMRILLLGNVLCVRKGVRASAFNFHSSDNISSPAGQQFIRPSGTLFDRSLQAETVFGSFF